MHSCRIPPHADSTPPDSTFGHNISTYISNQTDTIITGFGSIRQQLQAVRLSKALNMNNLSILSVPTLQWAYDQRLKEGVESFGAVPHKLWASLGS